jgi:uncharacterized protein YegP (UPF0339 family)
MRRSWTSTAKAVLWLSPLLLVLGYELTPRTEPTVEAQERTRDRKLRIRDRAAARRLDQAGGRLVADYGSYLLYEVPNAMADQARRDSAVELLDEYRFVLLNSGSVDTGSASSIRNRRAPSRERFDGKRMRLVQLVGPSRPEWLAAIRDTGAQVVAYVPHNAYVVYGDAATAGALADLESTGGFIQWQSPYRNEHKVHPRARRAALLRAQRRPSLERSESGAQPREDLYAVQLVNDAEANATTIGLVRASSRGAVRSEFRVRNYVNVIAPLTSADMDALAARPDVVSIQPFVVPEKADERQGQIVAGDLSGSPGYLDFLAANGFTQQQFTQSGFAVDISDSGVDNATTHPNHPGLYVSGNTSAASRLIYGRLEGIPLFGDTIEGCDGHGNINAHIIAGFNDGLSFPFADADGFRYGLGIAPFVKVGSSVIFAPNFTYPSYPNLQSRAYRDGARISSNSWGGLVYGAYDVTAQTFDALVRDAQPAGAAVAAPGNQQMVIVVAAGNEGIDGLRSPGTAKNVITVGASENVHFLGDFDGCGLDDTGADDPDDIADFSSRGPAEDGRMKPDLVAPGTHVSGGVYQSATPGPTGQAHPCFDGTSVCGTGTGGVFFPSGQEFYTTSSGTSHSTPAVAGAAALVRQFFINQGMAAPSPAMTKAVFISSARYLDGEGANDNLWSASQGMGALNLGVAFDDTPRVLRDQRSQDIFTASGQFSVVTGTIADPTRPFRVTLAWTDAPGSTTGPAFNNDLDLAVTIDGETYKGNVFSRGRSIAGGSADLRNNVESVFLPAGTSGDFTVAITASNINSDGIPNFGGALDQDFALVVYNGDEVARPAVVGTGATLVSEACGIGNGVLDPGEEVTVNFALRNIGTADTSQVVAILEEAGGVTSPSGPQSYGQLLTAAPAVSRSFSFVADGTCGGEVLATLSLQDGGVDIGTVRFAFDLGLQVPSGLSTTLANNASVLVPVGGPASPYPSTIDVSGMTGRVSRVRVGLHGVNHGYPDDIDVLLVAPGGQGAVLMSDAGGGIAAQGVNLTFDDSAGAALPDGGPIASGQYRLSNYEGAADDFTEAAPSEPFVASLAELNGVDPNGTWSLYVVDDFFLDGGDIANGWSLSLETSVPICCGGAPGISLGLTDGLATTEAGGAATFTVSLRSSPSDTVTIGLESSDPTEGVVSPAELTFEPDDAQLPRAVTITGVDDALLDGDVTFTIVTSPAVSADSDYSGLDAADISVVNRNNDFPSLTIGDVSLVEGTGGTTSFVFPVALSQAASYDVSVAYATQNGTAVAGSDYVAAAGSLVFAAGTVGRTIPISVAAETLVEANETFFVDLSGAVGATIGDVRGVGTIVNDDAPSVSVSKTSLAMGETAQVTVADGPANRTDWVTLAKVGTPLTTYVDWLYLSGTKSLPPTGLMSAVLQFPMPATPGHYEFRFLANNGYTLLATSPAVTGRPPVLGPSATSVTPGGSLTVTVADGSGNRGDWVALAQVGSALTSYHDWKYLNGTRSLPPTGLRSASLPFTMPQTPGSYEFRFLANNGYTLFATSPPVAVELPTTPVLSVSPASLSFGTVVTGAGVEQSVTVRNAGGGTLVGQASVSGTGFNLVGSGSYSLGANATALVTVRFAPSLAGPASGVLTLTGAGGATVFLTGTGDLPPANPVLSVSPSSLVFAPITVGTSAELSVNVQNAGAGTLVGNASVTGTGFSLVGTTAYSLGPGGAAVLTVRFAPSSAGPANGTLALTGGGGANVPLAGTGTAGAPSVAVSATSVRLGGTLTVTVSGGPGNRTDWVALAQVGSPPNVNLGWKYLSGTQTQPPTGLTFAELSFTIPQTAGQYEFRFLANNGYTLLAKSPVVTTIPPTVTVSATSAAPGAPIQVTIQDGPAYRGDWVALAKVGSPVTANFDWKYLNGTRTMPATGAPSAVLSFTMPLAPDQYVFRFFANNGYTLLATSPMVIVASGTN